MVYTKKKRKLKIKIQWLIFTFVFIAGLSLIVAYLNRPLIEEELIQEPIIEVKELTTNEKLILGARKDAIAMPAYISAYYDGGYPPEEEGTCTDLVWRAFKEAGVLLKDLVDEDIKNNRSNYSHIKYRDPNIDFRRVQNLTVYFKNNAEVLTNDIYDTSEWKAGDIVVFGDNEHIGIVSDIRNENDIPYLIHNNDQPLREEDRLEYGYYTMGVTGHYRFRFGN
jgi:uncharacterized protein